jgi:propanediol dehydratase small subunit
MVEELKNTIEKTEKSTIQEIQAAAVKAETAKKLATEAKTAYDKKMAELEEAKKNKDGFSIANINQKSVAGGVVLAEYTQMVTTDKQATIANTVLQTLKSESSKVLIGLNGQLNKAKESKEDWDKKLKLAEESVKKYQ